MLMGNGHDNAVAVVAVAPGAAVQHGCVKEWTSTCAGHDDGVNPLPLKRKEYEACQTLLTVVDEADPMEDASSVLGAPNPEPGPTGGEENATEATTSMTNADTRSSRAEYTYCSGFIIELSGRLSRSERRRAMARFMVGGFGDVAASEYAERRVMFRTSPVSVDASAIGQERATHIMRHLDEGRRDIVPQNEVETELVNAVREGFPVKLCWRKTKMPCANYNGIDLSNTPGIKVYLIDETQNMLEPLAGPHCITDYFRDIRHALVATGRLSPHRYGRRWNYWPSLVCLILIGLLFVFPNM
jgi:hypothetical protein